MNFMSVVPSGLEARNHSGFECAIKAFRLLLSIMPESHKAESNTFPAFSGGLASV